MWKPVRLFTFKRKFDFLVHRRAALIISTLINIVSIVGVLTIGLNFGIDFKGGIAIQAKAKDGTAELDQLRLQLGRGLLRAVVQRATWHAEPAAQLADGHLDAVVCQSLPDEVDYLSSSPSRDCSFFLARSSSMASP